MRRTATPQKSRFKDPIKEVTLTSLKRVLDPLVDLMFDAGITVHEFSQLLKERSVRIAARRVSKESGRDSKSRVAIMTGLTRSEVARIVTMGNALPIRRTPQHPARKVLAAWFDNPRFLAANGEPAVLPIFGKRRSFEQLVAMHSRGAPVRAMLDELTQIDAVERLSDQRIRAKSRIPILTGLTGNAIGVIGERTGDLLETLMSNLRRESKPFFVGTAVIDETDREKVSLVRRDIAEQGANFINGAASLLSRSCVRQTRQSAKTSAKCRLGVTVYYFQDDIDGEMDSKTETAHRQRKNLQRQRHPSNKKRTKDATSPSGANVRL